MSDKSNVIISKVVDDKLLGYELDLYSGNRMPRDTFESKKEYLYIIYTSQPQSPTTPTGPESNISKPSDPLAIGYIQFYPIDSTETKYTSFKNKNFWAIEEIEIFKAYRSNKYGSKIVTYLKDIYNLLIIDIQETALRFWLNVMGDEYWNLIMSFDSRDKIITQLKYSGNVAHHFLTY